MTMKLFAMVRNVLGIFLISLLYLVSVSASSATEVIYYHNNVVGSPVAATDESGHILWKEDYTPYGTKISDEMEAIIEKVGYTGHRYDNATGLVYAGARMYDPSLGRFMGIDPVGASAAIDNPVMFNRYAYGNNNPYKYVDPDGESPVDVIFLAADLARLGDAVYSGNPEAIQSATIDVVASLIGVASPVPGVGQALKVAKAGKALSKVPKGVGPKAGSAGGDGAKKAFSNKIQDQARKESNDTCVFCGTKTNRQPGPTRSEIDHAIPKSRGGNNTIENAQNTCRTCNRSKGAKTTDEFINR